MLMPMACSSMTKRLDRHLALMMLHQHEAAQLRAEMAADAVGQRRQDGLALRRQPAFAAVTHRPRAEHEILHLVQHVAFELGPRRNPHAKHFGLRLGAERHAASAATCCGLAARRRLGRVLHAARLDGWAAFEALQPRDLVALRRHDTLQLGHVAEQSYQQSFQLGTGEIRQIGGWWHA